MRFCLGFRIGFGVRVRLRLVNRDRVGIDIEVPVGNRVRFGVEDQPPLPIQGGLSLKQWWRKDLGYLVGVKVKVAVDVRVCGVWLTCFSRCSISLNNL